MIWANLIHLSTNMWSDVEAPEWPARNDCVGRSPTLRFDTKLWNTLLRRMAEAGMNMVVLDLGDGVRYESRPEIAVRRAWTPERLRRELAKMRKLGLEPIPKLNFSTAHDTWLGPYARQVSSDAYYAVCRDLIAEVIDLFDKPRLFHLGMDEETAAHQRHYEHVALRQGDLWWRDLYFLIDRVESGGSRAWVWSDLLWRRPEEFLEKMPRSVLQSSGYYGPSFVLRGPRATYLRAYLQLDEHGYDQVLTGSTCSNDVNFAGTVAFARKRIAPERLKGFLQTTWVSTRERNRKYHEEAVDQVGAEIARWK